MDPYERKMCDNMTIAKYFPFQGYIHPRIIVKASERLNVKVCQWKVFPPQRNTERRLEWALLIVLKMKILNNSNLRLIAKFSISTAYSEFYSLRKWFAARYEQKLKMEEKRDILWTKSKCLLLSLNSNELEFRL